jgi:hypothetical protein
MKLGTKKEVLETTNRLLPFDKTRTAQRLELRPLRRSARSQSLCRLRYPGSLPVSGRNIICGCELDYTGSKSNNRLLLKR